jgi:hypothetical protein
MKVCDCGCTEEEKGKEEEAIVEKEPAKKARRPKA